MKIREIIYKIKNINYKSIASFCFGIVLTCGGIFVFLNGINYFDPVGLCYVDIDKDILRGNKKTIVEALRKIKRESKDDYKTVCRYTRKISENFCLASDWHLNPSWHESYQGKSCFIRGSKTIYIYPRKEYSQDIVVQRAEEIKKYSNFSKEFWERSRP